MRHGDGVRRVVGEAVDACRPHLRSLPKGLKARYIEDVGRPAIDVSLRDGQGEITVNLAAVAGVEQLRHFVWRACARLHDLSSRQAHDQLDAQARGRLFADWMTRQWPR